MTTQNKWLQSGLDPADKGVRVMNYSIALERDLQMITESCGLRHPSELHRGHVVAKVAPGVRKSLLELYPYPRTRIAPSIRTTPNLERPVEARLARGASEPLSASN